MFVSIAFVIVTFVIPRVVMIFAYVCIAFVIAFVIITISSIRN